jgi:uncharacterized membrane protein
VAKSPSNRPKEIVVSDQVQPAYAATEDKTLPMVAYVLYLLGHVTGVTILIALVVAYANRASAGPVAASHYNFLIRTFWMSLGWWVVGVAMIAVGFPLSFVLVGIPIFVLGWLVIGAIWIWAVVRCVMGLMYLAQDQAHPRLATWLL